MKKIFTLLLFCLSLFTVQSQTGLDFSFTDTKGVVHTLSEALAEDKVVLLDFFFVDCGPCQDWAPDIEKLIEDHEGTTLEVWSISDRDSDAYIDGSMFNPSHPNHFSGGSNGNGGAAVNLYANNFNFTGFPTFALICNDNSITWDIWPLTPGVSEIRNLLTEDCGVKEAEVSSIPTIEGLNGIKVTPNPTTDLAMVSFDLSTTTHININLYNNLGQQVQTIDAQQFAAGAQQVTLNTSTLANGIYTLKLQSADGVESVQVQVLK